MNDTDRWGSSVGEWAAGVIGTFGYLGVAFLMLAENLFPPIPSEAILPLTGFLVGRGDLAFLPALVVATSGSLLGAFALYALELWARLRALIRRSGGEEISVSTSRQNGQVRLAVSDTGMGVPKEQIPHIFERFYMTDEARAVRRTGLGLSMARQIAEAHGGSLTVESENGEGSTLRAPMDRRRRGPRRTPGAPAPSAPAGRSNARPPPAAPAFRAPPSHRLSDAYSSSRPSPVSPRASGATRAGFHRRRAIRAPTRPHVAPRTIPASTSVGQWTPT